MRRVYHEKRQCDNSIACINNELHWGLFAKRKYFFLFSCIEFQINIALLVEYDIMEQTWYTF